SGCDRARRAIVLLQFRPDTRIRSKGLLVRTHLGSYYNMDRTCIVQLRPIPNLVDSDILAMGNTVDLSFRDLFVEGTGQIGPIQSWQSICSQDSHWLL